MKKKNGIKLIASNFNPEDNTSTAIIKTPRGIFCAHSTLNPLDMDVKSEFIGCRCAELKATIKYLKVCRNEVSAQIKVMEDFHKNLKTSYRFKIGSYIDKRLKKEIYDLYYKKTKINNQISKATEEIIHGADKRRESKEHFYGYLDKQKDKSK